MPTAWRGSLPVLEEFEEDAKPMKRCEEKRKERAKYWQCDSEVQSHGEGRSQEDAWKKG